MLILSLAQEIGSHRITVNAYAPGETHVIIPFRYDILFPGPIETEISSSPFHPSLIEFNPSNLHTVKKSAAGVNPENPDLVLEMVCLPNHSFSALHHVMTLSPGPTTFSPRLRRAGRGYCELRVVPVYAGGAFHYRYGLFEAKDS